MVRPTKRTKNNKPCADLDIAAAKLRPSKVTLRALQTAYDHFNRELFGGTLPRCLITLQGLRAEQAEFRPLLVEVEPRRSGDPRNRHQPAAFRVRSDAGNARDPRA